MSFELGTVYLIVNMHLSLSHIFSLSFSLVGVGPASIMVGNLVAGKRIAQAAGRDLGMIEDQDLIRKVGPPQDLSLIITPVRKDPHARWPIAW